MYGKYSFSNDKFGPRLHVLDGYGLYFIFVLISGLWNCIFFFAVSVVTCQSLSNKSSIREFHLKLNSSRGSFFFFGASVMFSYHPEGDE